MIKYLLSFFFLIFFEAAFAQTPSWLWAKDANSSDPETAWDVIYDSFSDNVFIGGSFRGNLSSKYGASFATTTGNKDGFVAKYDQTGTVLWAIKITGTNDEEVISVAVDGLGNVYACGTFDGTADFDPTAGTFNLTSTGNNAGFLAKYSSTGALLWAVNINCSQDIAVWKMNADANSVYMTGSYDSPPATFYSYNSVVTKTTTSTDGQLNMFGAKYNASGVVQWVISGGGNKDDIGFNVTADATNVYFIGRYDADITFRNASGVAGTVLQAQNNNKPQTYITAFTQAGAQAWQTNITTSSGGSHLAIGWGITQDAANLYVTGYADGNINFKYPTPTLTQNLSAGGGDDLFLAKLTKAGVFTWVAAATGNGSGDQIGRALEVDASGNILLAGHFTTGLNYSAAGGPNHSSSGNQDLFVTSYANTGAFLWSVKAGGNNNEDLNGLSKDNAGGIYIAGDHGGAPAFGTFTLGSGGGTDIYVAKLGCPTILNNTAASSQTICSGNAPSSINGSIPTGGSNYIWQMSANSVTWTTASGTSNGQNYSPPPLTATTYYRRNVFASGTCSINVSNSNTITIAVNTTPSANAGSSQTVCSTSATLSALNPTAGTGAWSVVSGSGNLTTAGSASSQVTSLGTGTNVFMWTVSNSPCSSANSTVAIIRNAQPVSNAGSNQTICATTATFAAASPTVGTGAWSMVSGSGTITAVNNPSSGITSLGTGTTVFMWTVSNGICTAATSTVSIIRNVQPLSNAGSNQTVCATTATLAAVSPTAGIGSWSLLSGSGNVTAVSNPSSQITSLGTGTNSFVWTVSNGVCTAATSTVLIIRNVQPVSNAGSNQTVCATSVTLAAINPTAGTGSWSLGSGAGSIASAVNPSTTVTALGVGSNSFVWTVSNGVCIPATSTVTIVQNVQPTANAGSNQSVCATSATLAAVTPTIGTGVWSLLSGSGNITSTTNSNSQITALGTGTNIFLWTVTNGSCPSATAAVTITRDVAPTANAGSNQTVCATGATLNAVNPSPGSGAWSVISGAGTITSVNSFSSTVTSLATGNNSFLWTVPAGSCPSATSAVTIWRDSQPTANAGASQTVCSSSATLAAVNPTVGTGAWSLLSGSGNITSANNPSSPITSLGAGTNTFLWTVSNGSCPSSTSAVNINKDSAPTANAGASQTVCATGATLNATSPTVGTGSWSLLTGSGVVTTINSPSSQVTSLGSGINSFLWTVSNGVCTAATSTVTFVRDLQPTANAGSNQTVCASSAMLAAVPPTPGSGIWSVLSGGSNVTSVINPSSPVTALSNGSNVFVWTVSNGSCPSATAAVTISRDVQPTANAGSNQTVCTSSTTLAAITPTAGTGVWSLLSGSGNLTTVSNPSSPVTALGTGANSFVWTVSNGSCPSATSSVTITRDAQPTAGAGTNQTVCATSATLNATAPSPGTGTWSLLSGSGNITSVNNSLTQITSLGTGTNSFLWTVANGSCPSATASVIISRDVQPTANAGSNQTICASGTTLNAVIPSVGTGTWSVGSGGGSVSSVNSPSSPATGLGAGNNSFVWTVANGVCAAASATVLVTVGASLTAQAGSDQTVCVSTATLNAIGTGTWSVLSGSGNVTSVNDPNSPVTSLSTGANSFLWTIPNSNCPTSAATVTIVRDVQPTSSAGVNQSFCSSSATLAATNPAVGTGAWSLLSGAGTIASVNSASSSVTALATGTNAFVWTVSNGVCTAATSTVLLISDAQPTASAGSSQTVCASTATLAAVSPAFGTGSWALLSGSGNLTAAGNPFTQITSLGTGSNSFLWTVSNGSCPSATAAVTLIRDAQPTANAGSSQTLCASASTLNAVSPAIGTGAWSVISGAATITGLNNPSSSVTSLSTGTNTFLWTVTNGSCPSATSVVNIVRDIQPTSNAGVSQSVCTSSATLAAFNPSAGTGIWSLLSGSGNLSSASNPSSQVTSLGTGSNSFLWTVSNGSCPSATAAVSITRDVQPTANAGSNQTVCASSATLSASSLTVGTGTWSLLSGSGNITSVNSSTSSITSLGTGANSFLWTVSNGSCPSATAAVSITRNSQPTANAGSNQTVCASTVTLAAVSPTAGIGTWSLLSGSGNITGINNPSTAVTSLGTGTNSFLWTVNSGSCPSATASVIIIQDAQPVANAGNNQSLCATSATLNAVSPAVGTGAWSLISGSGNITSVTNPSTQVTSISTGTSVLLWTVSNGSCPSATASVTITRDVQPTANAGSNQSVCASSATLAAINPTVGLGSWFLLSGSGNLTAASNPSTPITSLGTGTNSFLWTVSNGSCPSATASVTIIRDAQPSANAGSNQTICAVTATLAALSPPAGTGVWSLLSGSGNITSATNFSTQVTSLGAGNNSFVWTVSNGSCPSATASVIISRDVQPVSNAGSSQTLCAVNATLAAISPTAGTGAWSLLSGSGNVTSASSASSPVTALGTGTNSFIWTVSNGSCPPATSTVTIIRYSAPTSNAGSNQTVCASSATLAAISLTNGTGAWSLFAGSGNIISVSSPSSQVTALGTGTNSFVWTVSNGVCAANSSTVLIIRSVQPTANAGINQSVCAASATLGAVSPTAGTGSWSLLSGSGNVTSVNSASSAVTTLGLGTNAFVWTVSNGACVAATSTVLIIRDVQPVASAGSSQTICSSSATLAAVNPTTGTGAWSMLSGFGNITSINNPSTQVTSLSTGTNTILWTVTNGSCPSATSAVTIVNDVMPNANAGSDQTVCVSSGTLAAVSPAVGAGIWSLLSGSGNIVSVSNPSSAITALGTGTNSFVWTVSNGSCPSASSTVTLSRDIQPLANAGSDQTVCVSGTTLNAVNPSVGTGTWSTGAGTATVVSVNSPSSQVTSLSTGTNSFIWTVTNGVCPPSSSTVMVTLGTSLTAQAGSNQTVCASTATLSAIGTGTWSVLSGTASISAPNNPNSPVTGLSIGANSFVWTIPNSNCPTSAATVTIVREVQPTANAGSNQTLCASSATLAAVSPTFGTGAWSLVSGSSNITSVNNASSTVTSLGAGANSFLWTVSNGSCPSATSIVTFVRDVQPTANAGNSQIVCAASATLAAIAPTVGTGVWSLFSGAGTITATGNPSTAVTSLGTGSNSFVWTVSNGSCPSATSSVIVARDVQPTANAGSNQVICSASVTLSAVSPTLGTGAWSLLSGSGNLTAVSNPSTAVTSVATGTNVFVWTVSNGSCPSATASVSITRDVLPSAVAGNNQTVCASSATLSAVNPTVGAGVWSVISGTGTITSATNFSSTVTSLSTGTNSFLWTVSNGSCPSATSAVTITRDLQPTANAGISQTLCASSATLSALSPSVGSGIWSLLSGSGNLVAANSPSSSVTSLGTGTNTFLWTVYNGSCPSATAAVNIITDSAPLANAGSNQTLCASVATLSATNPIVGTGVWSVLSGTGTVTSANSFSSTVTSLSPGTNSFLWTVSNGSCPSATDVVTIVSNNSPTANAGSSQTLCSSAATLNAIVPTVGTGAWTLLSGSGNITAVSNPSSPVTSLGTGTNSFLWTVSNGSCPPATSSVVIVRDAQPVANAGSNQTVCISGAILNAVIPSVGTGTWSVIQGTASVTSINNPLSPVTSLSPGANGFVWTVSNGICTASSSTVIVTVGASLTAQAGSDQTVCVSTATFNAIGTGTWSVIGGSGNVTSVNNPNSEVTALSTGTNSFVWTIAGSSCPTIPSTVTIVREVQPTANAGSSQTLCSASTTSLNAVAPVVGTGAWSLLSGSGNLAAASNPSSTVTSLGTGTNSFLWTVSNTSCPSATASVVVVNDVQPIANAGISQTLCASSATLAAINFTTGIGSWSVLSGSGNLSSVSNPSSQVTSLGTGTNSFLWTVSNGSCPSATSAVILTNDIPPTANAGSSQTVCALNATLNALSPATGNGSWSLLSGTGTITSVNSETTGITALGTGTNSFLWTVINGSCPSATSAVIIINDALPNADAGSNQTICATASTLSAVSPSVGSGSWSLLTGSGNITSVNSPTSAVTALATGTNSFLWTVANGVCAPVSSTVYVISGVSPSAQAGTDQEICSSTATLNAINPSSGSGSWSLITGSASIVSAANPSTQITSLGTGANIFAWTVSDGVCAPVTATIAVTVHESLIANAGADQEICSTTATLNAVNPVNATGTWSLISGSGIITSAGSAASQLSALSTGTNSFVWTVSNIFCPSATDTIIIIKDAEATLAVASSSQQVCGSTVTLAANAPAIGAGAWKIISGNGVFSNVGSPQSALDNLSPGTNTIAWVISSGVCPPSGDTINIISDLPPSIANAGQDIVTCSDNATLAPVAPQIGTGTWSVISGDGTLLQDNLSVNLPTASKTVLRWVVSNGSCAQTSDDLEITKDPGGDADAGTDQTVETSETQLGAILPPNSTGKWSVVEGDAQISDVHDPLASVSKLSFGNNVFRWNVSGRACPESNDDILVFVKPFMIPNGFSPNGDGINDYFVISSLGYYSHVKFSVFNRWGALLYNNSDYKNDWAGTNSNGEKLSDDTYYYTLTVPELKTFTGFVIVKQNK